MTRLERWHAGHARLALALTLPAAALGASLPAPGAGLQAGLLAGLVAVLGLPHGAVDHLSGKILLRPRFGWGWPLVFGGLYSLAALAVIGLWWLWPPGVLVGFLILAIVHFGAEDVASAPVLPPGRAGHAARVGRAGEALVRGAVPVSLPVLFHPDATAALFAALLPEAPAEAVRPVLAALAPMAGGHLAMLAALALAGLARGAAGRGRILIAVEIAALVAAFASLPVLLAFAVYFCLWHAPRHTLATVAALDDADLRAGLWRFVRAAVPLTVATIALGGAVWALRPAGLAPDAAALRVVFIGLAALTVPHVALGAVLAAWREGDGATEGVARSRDI